MKSGKFNVLELFWLLQACNGTALPLLCVLFIFKTIYSFKIKSSFNNIFDNKCTVFTTDNTTISGIDYKE